MRHTVRLCLVATIMALYPFVKLFAGGDIRLVDVAPDPSAEALTRVDYHPAGFYVGIGSSTWMGRNHPIVVAYTENNTILWCKRIENVENAELPVRLWGVACSNVGAPFQRAAGGVGPVLPTIVVVGETEQYGPPINSNQGYFACELHVDGSVFKMYKEPPRPGGAISFTDIASSNAVNLVSGIERTRFVAAGNDVSFTAQQPNTGIALWPGEQARVYIYREVLQPAKYITQHVTVTGVFYDGNCGRYYVCGSHQTLDYNNVLREHPLLACFSRDGNNAPTVRWVYEYKNVQLCHLNDDVRAGFLDFEPVFEDSIDINDGTTWSTNRLTHFIASGRTTYMADGLRRGAKNLLVMKVDVRDQCGIHPVPASVGNPVWERVYDLREPGMIGGIPSLIGGDEDGNRLLLTGYGSLPEITIFGNRRTVAAGAPSGFVLRLSANASYVIDARLTKLLDGTNVYAGGITNEHGTGRHHLLQHLNVHPVHSISAVSSGNGNPGGDYDMVLGSIGVSNVNGEFCMPGIQDTTIIPSMFKCPLYLYADPFHNIHPVDAYASNPTRKEMERCDNDCQLTTFHDEWEHQSKSLPNSSVHWAAGYDGLVHSAIPEYSLLYESVGCAEGDMHLEEIMGGSGTRSLRDMDVHYLLADKPDATTDNFTHWGVRIVDDEGVNLYGNEIGYGMTIGRYSVGEYPYVSTYVQRVVAGTMEPKPIDLATVPSGSLEWYQNVGNRNGLLLSLNEAGAVEWARTVGYDPQIGYSATRSDDMRNKFIVKVGTGIENIGCMEEFRSIEAMRSDAGYRYLAAGFTNTDYTTDPPTCSQTHPFAGLVTSTYLNGNEDFSQIHTITVTPPGSSSLTPALKYFDVVSQNRRSGSYDLSLVGSTVPIVLVGTATLSGVPSLDLGVVTYLEPDGSTANAVSYAAATSTSFVDANNFNIRLHAGVRTQVDDRIIVVGSISSGQHRSGAKALLVMCLSDGGNVLWSRVFGRTTNEEMEGNAVSMTMAADGTNQINIVGVTGYLTLGAGLDQFGIGLTESGTLRWARRYEPSPVDASGEDLYGVVGANGAGADLFMVGYRYHPVAVGNKGAHTTKWATCDGTTCDAVDLDVVPVDHIRVLKCSTAITLLTKELVQEIHAEAYEYHECYDLGAEVPDGIASMCSQQICEGDAVGELRTRREPASGDPRTETATHTLLEGSLLSSPPVDRDILAGEVPCKDVSVRLTDVLGGELGRFPTEESALQYVESKRAQFAGQPLFVVHIDCGIVRTRLILAR